MSESEDWPKRIPLNECENGWLYLIFARNFSLGVCDVQGGFIGIREKFGTEFLFTEYHYDRGAPFGTVIPKKKLEACPADIRPGNDPTVWLHDNHRLFAWLEEKRKEYANEVAVLHEMP